MTTAKPKRSLRTKPPVKAADLVKHLLKKMKLGGASELASVLGKRTSEIRRWELGVSALSALQLASLIVKTHAAAQKHVHDFALQPIVEFLPIQPFELSNEKFEVFQRGVDGGKYLTGVYQQLAKTKSGLYIFYDSRGRALYVGQTKRQNIWKEMNLAFNRDRKDQIVTRVRHPRLDVEFKRINRQPLAKAEKLYNLASYFSAYEVLPNLVDNLEALLIRAFPNDVTNVKMQRIRRKKSAAKQSSKRIKKK